MLDALRERNEWRFFGTLARADRGLAVGWWLVLLVARAVAGVFRDRGWHAGGCGAATGTTWLDPWHWWRRVFVPMQVLPPLHRVIGANLGSRTAAWLYDRLTSCVRRPPGMGHLENAKLTSDLTMARDFDLAITGPADGDLDGFHRERAGGDDGGACRGGGAGRVRLVGAAGACGRMACDTLAVA